MHYYRLIIKALKYFLYALALVGCVTQRTSTTQTSKYSEDLTAVRPQVQLPAADTATQGNPNLVVKPKENVPAKFNVNSRLDATLDSINKNYLVRGYVDGFTIQVFTGDKEGALSAKRELTLALPDLASEMIYDAPTFRVKTGRYLELMEAQKTTSPSRNTFPAPLSSPRKFG
ncbi:MAG: hypothetical protein HC859_07560 [Bacteroidia bacterium]|nr:hypothetical protein [Bacteroidia bacterium]